MNGNAVTQDFKRSVASSDPDGQNMVVRYQPVETGKKAERSTSRHQRWCAVAIVACIGVFVPDIISMLAAAVVLWEFFSGSKANG